MKGITNIQPEPKTDSEVKVGRGQSRRGSREVGWSSCRLAAVTRGNRQQQLDWRALDSNRAVKTQDTMLDNELNAAASVDEW